MKVKEIATRKPQVIHPDAMICEAAQMMKKHDIGMLPVCEGQRVVGILTDRDLAIRAVGEGCDPQTTKVSSVMTEGFTYCFDDQEIEEAARTMEEKQIRRIAVLNREKQLVGVASLGDFALRSNHERLPEEILERVSQPGHRQ
jgi:CBS domain-containing protein